MVAIIQKKRRTRKERKNPCSLELGSDGARGGESLAVSGGSPRAAGSTLMASKGIAVTVVAASMGGNCRRDRAEGVCWVCGRLLFGYGMFWFYDGVCLFLIG